MTTTAAASESVLVTGASSGIGRELARLFAADRSNLILVARRRAELESLAADLHAAHGVDVLVLPKDLGQRDAAAEIVAELHDAGRQVDVLVNNAGFGWRGDFARMPQDRAVAMMQVNVVVLTELTRRLLPEMITRRRGGVLNVGSTAGFQPGPFMAMYYASKAYVLSLSEALAEETAGTGVTVTLLAPGATRTGFQSAAEMDSALLFKLGVMDAIHVAQAGYRGFRRGRALVIPGLKNKLGVQALRIAPRFVVRKLVKRLNAD